METALTILLLALAAGSSVPLAYWSIGLARFLRVRRRLPTGASGLSVAASEASVCVVIPAHDEEANIVPLIESLRAQDHGAMRVVLALDRCTDDTPGAARRAIGDDGRFEVIEIDACPEGWAGKVNAICRAVASSASARDADVLLFADADTAWHPSCLRATLGLLGSRGLDVLSLVCDVTTARWWEWAVQPAAGLELMRQYPLIRSNREGYPKPFVNGQFIMIRREAYQRIGGHEAVHDEMLEDLAIGRRAAEAGLRVGAFLAGGMVTCRMYDSWEEFARGWSRIYAESARRRVRRLRRAAGEVRALGTVLPAIALAAVGVGGVALGAGAGWPGAVALAVGALALVAQGTALVGAFRLAGLPWRSVAAYPVAAWMVGGILLRTARMVERGETARWGGREYRYAPRVG